MFKLVCDKCGKSIKPNDTATNISIEEQDYMGECEFMQTSLHYNGNKTLCSSCASQLLLYLKIVKDETPWI